jgi:hypothetical protein
MLLPIEFRQEMMRSAGSWLEDELRRDLLLFLVAMLALRPMIPVPIFLENVEDVSQESLRRF